MTNQNIAADLQMNGHDIQSTSALAIETISGDIELNAFNNLILGGDIIDVISLLDLNQNAINNPTSISNTTSDIAINTGVGFHVKMNNSLNMQGNRVYNLADGLLSQDACTLAQL